MEPSPNKDEVQSSPAFIKFKNIKKRPLRSKADDDGGKIEGTDRDDNKDHERTADLGQRPEPEEGSTVDDEDEDVTSKLEDLKQVRAMKRRLNKGINAKDLLTIRSQESQAAKEKAEHVAGLMTSLDLANTFSVETNRRDEDQDMLKFIEEQLAAKKGLINESSGEAKHEMVDPDDLVFDKLRENLLKDEQKKNEEMLSSQMLSGIPEVDLGVDEKIRNIEATEAAKRKLMEKKLKQKSTFSKDPTLVPTNVAANYVQHNRFNINNNYNHHNNSDHARNQHMYKKPRIDHNTGPSAGKEISEEDKRQVYLQRDSNQSRSKLKFPGKERATDDFYFEKFKKQFRK